MFFGWTALTVLVCPWYACAETLEVTFINVGHGDSTLIETPAGQKIMIDGGDKDQGSDTLAPFLLEKGIRRIDKMIVSNNDSDHYQGFTDLLADGRFTVGTLYHSEPFAGADFPAALSNAVNAAITAGRLGGKVELTTATSPTLDFGAGVTAELFKAAIVAPGTADSRNANSNVIKLTFNRISFLFTGDSDNRSLTNIMTHKGTALQSTVLKVPHHASANLPTAAVSGAFADMVKPKLAVVSVGGTSFGLPDPETLKVYSDRSIRLLRTNQRGNISVKTNGVSYSVSTSLTDSATTAAGSVSDVHVYPNPVKGGSGTVAYTLDGKADSVKVRIHTLSGDLARELDGTGASGSNFVAWDGNNQEGRSAASGLYWVTVEARSGNSSATERSRFAVIRQ